MTEILQALMHFFEKINTTGAIPFDEQLFVSELRELGVPQKEIQELVSWINDFSKKAEKTHIPYYPVQKHSGTRIFTPVECQHISKKQRSLLLDFEQHGILSPVTRELVIDELLQLHPEEITTGRVKWLILRILTHQSDQLAIANMERFLLFEAPGKLN